MDDLTLIDSSPQVELSIYPYPSDGYLNIDGANLTHVAIFDAVGKLIITNDNPNNQVDISELTTGIYFLKLQNETNSWTARIVKN